MLLLYIHNSKGHPSQYFVLSLFGNINVKLKYMKYKNMK